MHSGVGELGSRVALTAAKVREKQGERVVESERDRENNGRTRCVQVGGVTRSCFNPVPRTTPKTNEGVTAVTRSLRGVIVV